MQSAFKIRAENTQMFVHEGELKENLECARKVETILFPHPRPPNLECNT